MSRYVVRKDIRIKASPDRVWDALINPEKTKKYFYNYGVYSDWKPGSTITFKGKMFLIFNVEMKGKILAVIPGQFLAYTLKNGGKNKKEWSESKVTDTLRYENGETVLSISDDVGDEEGAEKRYKRSDKGWDKVLKGLKKMVEEEG